MNGDRNILVRRLELAWDLLMLALLILPVLFWHHGGEDDKGEEEP